MSEVGTTLITPETVDFAIQHSPLQANGIDAVNF